MLAFLLQTASNFNWHQQQLYDAMLPYVQSAAVALLIWITAKLHLNSDRLKAFYATLLAILDALQRLEQVQRATNNVAAPSNPTAAVISAVEGATQKDG